MTKDLAIIVHNDNKYYFNDIFFSVSRSKYVNTEEFIVKVGEQLTKNLGIRAKL